MSDALLITWFVTQTICDLIVWCGIAYLVFWRGRSGWWFLLAAALSYSPQLYKALLKRYGLQEEEEK